MADELEAGKQTVLLEDGSKFEINTTGLASSECEKLLQEWGRNELEEKRTPKWLIFCRQLWLPMPIMIWVAIISEFSLCRRLKVHTYLLLLSHADRFDRFCTADPQLPCFFPSPPPISVEAVIKDWVNVIILLVLQFGNATLSWYEETKAGDAVAALKNSLKPKATVMRDGTWENVDAGILVPGDMVLLASGAAVPADCIVNHGTIDVDQAALTGESLPVTMTAGSSVKMGSTVTRGEVEATVQATGSHTFFGKTAALLQSVDEAGHFQKILLKIMIILAGLSLVLCLICLFYLIFAQHVSFLESLAFTVVVLVASIPIAMEVVCTSTMALGSRQLSEKKAIVSRLSAIEEVAGMNMLCSDKTGTLTLNKMVIQEATPCFQEGLDQATVLRYAAMAAKWKEPPKDALDTLVLTSADLSSLNGVQMLDHVPFDPTVKRTESTVKDTNGEVIKVSKGAPNILIKLLQGSRLSDVEARLNAQVEALAMRGIRCLAVARTNSEGEWIMLGLLTFLDPPRPDTKETIHRAIHYGVDVKMITGDHGAIAKETARQLGMGDHILGSEGLPAFDPAAGIPSDLGSKYGELIMSSDGFSGVYPEHKYLIVEALRQSGLAVAMTGDGVNDAPALKRADVGIAVQGATDAARAAADIVLTAPGLSVIIDAIIISRCIFRRMKSFLIYRIASTLEIVCFFFISVLAFHPTDYNPDFPVYFSLPVLMLILITVLNDGTIITIAYDHVLPSDRPEKWHLKVVFLVSIVLGAVACLSSLLLLYWGLDSGREGSLFQRMGLPAMQYGEIVTIIYLKISVSDFLTIFSARSEDWFFKWKNRPHWILCVGAVFACSLSVLLAAFWPTSEGGDGEPPVTGLARADYSEWIAISLAYSVVCWFIQDAIKVLTYAIIYRFNVFGINTSNSIPVRETRPNNVNIQRASVVRLERKTVEHRLDAVINRVSASSAGRDPKTIQRVSMALGRGSVASAASSIPESKEVRVPVEPAADGEALSERVHSALGQLDAHDRAGLEGELEDLGSALVRLDQATALARKIN
mmetsp:Transcript_39283/g.111218  ORF Transcript_39283/g.111218 Transcript_39283/m.111218 type:complete len:1040 (+) Transcript_39283:189-3308(+)